MLEVKWRCTLLAQVLAPPFALVDACVTFPAAFVAHESKDFLYLHGQANLTLLCRQGNMRRDKLYGRENQTYVRPKKVDALLKRFVCAFPYYHMPTIERRQSYLA